MPARRTLPPPLNTRSRTRQSLPRDPTPEGRDPDPDQPASDDGENASATPSASSPSSSSRTPPTLTMTDFLNALAEARAEIAELKRERDAAKISPLVGRGVKIGQPAPFDGKVSEYLTFMSQCQLHFTVYPESFRTSESKVLFIISYLTGNARSWATDILNQKTHPLRRNYDAFQKSLDVLYLDRNLRHQARDRLSRLKQTKSAAAYSVEFQQIITPLKLDNNAKCIFFYIGLKDTVKDTLATVGESEKFAELVDQVIAIDQRQHQRRMEEKRISSKPVPDPGTKNENGKRPASAPPSRSSTPAPGFKSGDKPGKSQPRLPVSDVEKKRRRENKLCFYCGKADHRIENCPDRLAKPAASAIVPQYSFSPSFPESEN
jgi:Retrotransposon gag protein